MILAVIGSVLILMLSAYGLFHEFTTEMSSQAGQIGLESLATMRMVLIGIALLSGLNILALVVALIRKRSKIDASRSPGGTSASAESSSKDSKQVLINQTAVRMLGHLQHSGRFLDFLMEPIEKYPNEQVGVVARIVHQGCKKVVEDYFKVEQIRAESEGALIDLPNDFDRDAVKLLGTQTDVPPFKGKLLHKGWKAVKVNFPYQLDVQRHTHSDFVIAPAELEKV